MMYTQTFLEELELQQAGEALAEPEDELITLYFYAARGQNRFLLEVSDASSLRALKRQAAKEINRCVRALALSSPPPLPPDNSSSVTQARQSDCVPAECVFFSR
jgi:hypothetical protein